MGELLLASKLIRTLYSLRGQFGIVQGYSQQEIAEILSVQVATVRKKLIELEDKGLLIRIKPSEVGKTTTYRLKWLSAHFAAKLANMKKDEIKRYIKHQGQ